ncbi:hypothetical protein FS749_008614 [Ceratobasidium sp. UAMH 11750]|nr:hypothetical protein FS749_008614 [Ceratobasidium sp. UAMH 11750]
MTPEDRGAKLKAQLSHHNMWTGAPLVYGELAEISGPSADLSWWTPLTQWVPSGQVSALVQPQPQLLHRIPALRVRIPAPNQVPVLAQVLLLSEPTEHYHLFPGHLQVTYFRWTPFTSRVRLRTPPTTQVLYQAVVTRWFEYGTLVRVRCWARH